MVLGCDQWEVVGTHVLGTRSKMLFACKGSRLGKLGVFLSHPQGRRRELGCCVSCLVLGGFCRFGFVWGESVG